MISHKIPLDSTIINLNYSTEVNHSNESKMMDLGLMEFDTLYSCTKYLNSILVLLLYEYAINSSSTLKDSPLSIDVTIKMHMVSSTIKLTFKPISYVPPL